jgi:hypothetical protein
MAREASDEIPALNAAAPITTEYPVASLYEVEACVGADHPGGRRGANLKG